MRTPAYQGVMQARFVAAKQEHEEAAEQSGPPDPDEVPYDVEATITMEEAG